MFTVLASLWSFSGYALNLDGTIFDEVGREKGLDPKILYAIALAESAYSPKNNGWVSPYIYTLRTPTQPYYSNNLEQAKKTLATLLKQTESIDVGVMQINIKWHKQRVHSPEDLLDLRTNLAVGADILNERLLACRGDWKKAIGQYHSFDPERGRRYAELVLNIFSSLDSKNDIIFW